MLDGSSGPWRPKFHSYILDVNASKFATKGAEWLFHGDPQELRENSVSPAAQPDLKKYSQFLNCS